MKTRIKSVKSAASTCEIKLIAHSCVKSKKEEKFNEQNIPVSVENFYKEKVISQNTYVWTLVAEMAALLSKPIEEIYFRMLQYYGQSFPVSVRKDDIKNFERSHNYFELLEVIGNASIYMVYVDSAKYSHEEMLKFVDGINREAEAIGVLTLISEELDNVVLN